jgi:hypothetical protein
MSTHAPTASTYNVLQGSHDDGAQILERPQHVTNAPWLLHNPPSRDANTSIRQSSRLAKKPRQVHTDDLHYPDGAPITEFERAVAQLNFEAFPSSSYAQIDEILVWSLFASKRRNTSRQALKPAASSSRYHSLITHEQALAIYERCRLIPRDDPTRNHCEATAKDLVEHFPDLLSSTQIAIIAQYVSRICIE